VFLHNDAVAQDRSFGKAKQQQRDTLGTVEMSQRLIPDLNYLFPTVMPLAFTADSWLWQQQPVFVLAVPRDGWIGTERLH
jgi:hypothetical protein